MWQRRLPTLSGAACALLVGLGLAVADLPQTAMTQAATTNVSVDAAQRFQRIDGFGVSVNPQELGVL